MPSQPPAPTTTPDDATVRSATRSVMWFAGLLLAALWFSAIAPPWPLPLLSGVLAIAAGVLGVRGLMLARRAKLGTVMIVLLVVGLVMAAGMIFVSVLQALMWPAYAELQQCLDRAITYRAEQSCLTELETNLEEWLWSVLAF